MYKHKFATASTKKLSENQIEAVVSTEKPDRSGDIVRQEGWDLASFLEHPLLLSSHNYFSLTSNIGKWVSMEVKSKKMVGVAEYFVGQGNPEADWAYNLATKGMAAFSVGFMFKQEDAKPIDGGGLDIGKAVLLEVSQVLIPANPQALQTVAAAAKGLSLDPDVQDWVETVLDTYQPGIALLDKDVITKPLPNEHACRLRDPGDFQADSFRRVEREHEGKPYSIIMGRLKDETSMTEQAYRYPKDDWTEAMAKRH